MVSSTAKTVTEYLADLPADRRAVVEKVRAFVRRHMPRGYVEGMGYGMISYAVPLRRYAGTHNGLPLDYVAIAAQKNHYSLYLMGCSMDPDQGKRLQAAYRSAGKRLDMGKSCLRFHSFVDLVPDAIASIVAAMTPDQFIALYEANRLKPR